MSKSKVQKLTIKKNIEPNNIVNKEYSQYNNELLSLSKDKINIEKEKSFKESLTKMDKELDYISFMADSVFLVIPLFMLIIFFVILVFWLY